jgi:DNA-binding NarL/FixJ family response regulator
MVVGGIRLHRDGLGERLGREDWVEVSGTARADEDAVARVREVRPDVVVLDVASAESHAALQALLTDNPGLALVALASEERDDDVIAWAEAGVAGYVDQEASLADLLDTIAGTARGQTIWSPRATQALLRRVATLATERGLDSTATMLTPRERQIAGLIQQRLSNKEIAQQLCIELATVKNHVHNILKKLKVSTRSEAADRVRHVQGVAGPRWRARSVSAARPPASE